MNQIKAVKQIADVITGKPEKFSELLPVLAVAVRSIRDPEMKAGLSALARITAERPELEKEICDYLPELSFAQKEGTP